MCYNYLCISIHCVTIVHAYRITIHVNVMAEGKRHLSAPMGTKSFVESCVSKKVEKGKSKIEKLSEIAKSQPQLPITYTALTKGLCSRWDFLLHTVPITPDLLQPLEEAIRQSFIPALIGRQK